MERCEKYVVYMILGDDEVVLYIGITKRMIERLTREHFTPNGHVAQACYREAKLILYYECVSKEDASSREEYLIKTQNPRYNEKHNKPGIFSYSIHFDWQYLPVDKSRLDELELRKPRRFRGRTAAGMASFEEYKQTLGISLSLNCSAARTGGPDPQITWLDGEQLGELVNSAWAECAAPGSRYCRPAANYVCEALSNQDWVCLTEYDQRFDDAELRMRERYIWGSHRNRIPWLTDRNRVALDELASFMQPWHTKTGRRRLVGTFATNLDVSIRLYNSRDNYFLTLAYLREALQAGIKIDQQYLLLDCDLGPGKLHDWFIHQSAAVGNNVRVSGVDVQPNQRRPYTVWCKGQRVEAESRWNREAFWAGRDAALRLNKTVWVYKLSEIRELEIALNMEFKRLMDGASNVHYHGGPFAFRDDFDVSDIATKTAPKPLVLS